MALMSASILALNKAHPEARLVIVAGPDNAALARAMPHVDAVVRIRPEQALRSLLALRRTRPDVVIDFEPWAHVNALLTALAGARYTIGYRTRGSRRHFAYDVAVAHRDTDHEVHNQGRLVEVLTGARCGPPLLTADARSAPALDHTGRYVVFHPWASGSGKRLKEWPAQNWADLAARLTRQSYAIVLTGAAADQPDSGRLADVIRRDVPSARIMDLAGKTSISGLLGLLDRAEAVVSVNTGVMHLAAALGRPTVGLSGPTNPARWGPYGPHTRSVSPSGGLHSYLNLGHEFPRSAISPMGDLPVDGVEAALASVL